MSLLAPGPPVATSALPPDIGRVVLVVPPAATEVNVYVLHGPRPALVDCGARWDGGWEALDGELRTQGVRLADIETVVLTHHHHDHAGMAALIQDRAGASIVAAAPLAPVLAALLHSMRQDERYAERVALRHGFGATRAAAVRRYAAVPRAFVQDVVADRVIPTGGTVTLGQRVLTLLPRPGHSPTDTILYDERDGTLFAGDHLLPDTPSNPFQHAPPDGPLPAADVPVLPTYLASLEATAALDAQLVLPGHGAPFTGHRALIADRRASQRRRADRILELLGARTTAAEIVDALWPWLPIATTFLALSQVLGHLHVLLEQGRVTCTVDGVARYERA